MEINVSMGNTRISAKVSLERVDRSYFNEERAVFNVLIEEFGFSRKEIVNSKHSVEELYGVKLSFDQYSKIIDRMLNTKTTISNENPHGCMGNGNSRKPRCEVRDYD